MTLKSEPDLAAPGAGLPAPELFIARNLFKLKCLMGSRQAFIERFKSERANIRVLLDSADIKVLGERVLIRRLRGLEDSSRYWSVLMTLDHLRITNEAFAMVVSELSHERSLPGKASTAAVKPSPDVTEDVVTAYEASCDFVIKTLNEVTNLKSQARFEHPWFGAMNAFEWCGLAGMHMGIHRGQIAKILKALA